MKTFTVSYPNGRCFHVSAKKRDAMLECGEIELIHGTQYRFVNVTRSFAGLSSIQFARHARADSTGSHFLNGSFVVELHGERHRESLETPEVMAKRLKLGPGFQAGQPSGKPNGQPGGQLEP